jgi:hypothetical protein
MQAIEGESHLAELQLIRRIEGATIPTVNYPASRRQKRSQEFAAVAAWENEGGAVRRFDGK